MSLYLVSMTSVSFKSVGVNNVFPARTTYPSRLSTLLCMDLNIMLEMNESNMTSG